MSVAIITGSCGLVGSEASFYFHELGFDIVGIDNDSREYFFGKKSSTGPMREKLLKNLSRYHHYDTDIRNTDEIKKIIKKYSNQVKIIIHAAAQPSHDWAYKDPMTDFTINALGTLNLLEAYRLFCPASTFIFVSTNKVYGDNSNHLPFIELKTRYEINESHPFFNKGVNEQFSIDNSIHSLFGVSKLSADLLTQEYGKNFGLKTGVFRCGCLTGPAHMGTEQHGFLSHLVKSHMKNEPYNIFGFKGKQVRDNLHSLDLVKAFEAFFLNPKPGEVYNLGGGVQNSCSILEAILIIEGITSNEFNYTVLNNSRAGDHKWWITDNSKFNEDHSNFHVSKNLKTIIQEIIHNERN